jgi:hypothetical protein
MRALTFALLTLVWPGLALAGPNPVLVRPGAHTSGVQLKLNDDIKICLGTGCDYWLIYNSSGSQFEIWTTDDDGGGTDGLVFSTDDGTDDVDFPADVVVTGAIIGGSHIQAGAASFIYFNGRAELSSPADGDLLIENAANSQGIKLKTSTTDGVLTLATEADGNAGLTLDGTLTAGIVNVGSTGNMEFNGRAIVRSPGLGDVTFEEEDTGGKTRLMIATDTLTFQGGAGDASKTSTSFIPDGALVVGFSSRVVTTGTTCTSMDIGVAGDTDIFADNASIADGGTTDNTEITAILSSQSLNPALAATDVTVTGVGGNCVSLVVDLYLHYIDTAAAAYDL